MQCPVGKGLGRLHSSHSQAEVSDENSPIARMNRPLSEGIHTCELLMMFESSTSRSKRGPAVHEDESHEYCRFRL